LVQQGWVIEGGGSINKDVFRRKIFMSPHEVDKLRSIFNNKDVYATPLVYSSTNQLEALKYGPFWIDFDYDDFDVVKKDVLYIINYLNTVYKIPPNMLQLFFSGFKGIHIIIRPEVFGIKPDTNLHKYFKIFSEDLASRCDSIDRRVYDHRRLFRLPNSINTKSGLYKIQLRLSEVRDLSINEIKRLAVMPRSTYWPEVYGIREAKAALNDIIIKESMKPERKKFVPSENFESVWIPPCINLILINGTNQGQRNDTAIALASFYYQQGAKEEDVVDLLFGWNQKCNPPLEEADIRRIVASEYKGEYTYGCTKLRELSSCDKNCKFWRE
jgi:hypothetical protein